MVPGHDTLLIKDENGNTIYEVDGTIDISGDALPNIAVGRFAYPVINSAELRFVDTETFPDGKHINRRAYHFHLDHLAGTRFGDSVKPLHVYQLDTTQKVPEELLSAGVEFKPDDALVRALSALNVPSYKDWLGIQIWKERQKFLELQKFLAHEMLLAGQETPM